MYLRNGASSVISANLVFITCQDIVLISALAGVSIPRMNSLWPSDAIDLDQHWLR